MRSYYRDGQGYVVVDTGMPESSAYVGVSDASWAGAIASLERTAIQCTGRDSGESAALEWAYNAGWISSAKLDEVEGPEDNETEDETMSNENRKNPADPNRYNAWRYPTTEEIARGRREDDMFYCGSSATKQGAFEFLDYDSTKGTFSGQVQWGTDGEVLNSP